MAKIHYEKIKFYDSTARDGERGVFLRVTGESVKFVTGIEVDKEGEEIEPAGHSQRIRVIEKSVIKWRREYHMDQKYGELVRGKPVWSK